MDLYDNAPVDRMWFGTEQKMGWIETPQTGADVSSLGRSENAVLENGGGVARNSWDSHKVFQFSWGNGATPSMVSLLQAYRNGSYGRGLLYFHDPMFYHTNLLPKRWADPSMAANYEAEPIIPDVWPTTTPIVATPANHPITQANYNVTSNYSSQSNNSEHFIPIPDGMTLVLGAVYSGTATLYVRTPAGISDIIPMNTGDSTVVNTVIRNQPWARIGIRKGAGAGQISIVSMTARLSNFVAASEGTSTSYTNLFTNPSFEAAGATVEVRRNLAFGTPGVILSTRVNDVSFGGDSWYQFTSTGATGGMRHTIPTTAGGLVGGATYTFSAEVANPGTTEITMDRVSFSDLGISSFTVPPGGRVIVSATGARADYTTGFNFADARAPLGTTFLIRLSTVVLGPMSSPSPFDGATQAIPDPDLSTAWLGTAGNSMSILTGVGVVGLASQVGVVAIRSSSWSAEGSYSMRLIPTSPTNNVSFASISYGGDTTTRGTMIITRRVTGPISGSTWSNGLGRIYWNPSPNVYSNTAPNEASITELRVYSPPSGAISSLVLPHGGVLDSGDVWYDMATLVANQDYSGTSFTGRTVGASWSGAPDSSTSTILITVPISGETGAAPWMSGEGHSGCRFQGNPTVVNYNGVNGGQIGLSAILQEVGAWE